ncbi:MAG: cytochrome c [Gammaproteobacteria bacterium]|nr:cytochrome c [Gammaproteobacteria bacterium]
MIRPLPIAACLALAFSLHAPAAFAQQPAGDADRGRALTYTCVGCHGIEGYKNAYPHYHVPKIGGQSAEYLANALTEYRRGTRRHPTMEVQAQSFSDQDIADIAAFLSGLTP